MANTFYSISWAAKEAADALKGIGLRGGACKPPEMKPDVERVLFRHDYLDPRSCRRAAAMLRDKVLARGWRGLYRLPLPAEPNCWRVESKSLGISVLCRPLEEDLCVFEVAGA